MSRLNTFIPGLTVIGTNPSLGTGGGSQGTTIGNQDPRYAKPTTTQPIVPVQAQTEEIASVNEENAIEISGIMVGRQRYSDEDHANLITRLAVQDELQNIQRAQAQAEAENDPAPTVSVTQSIRQTTSRTNVSNRRSVDASRALQKTQRTCNHKYDSNSRRCLYCGKHRDSHVYDVGSKSLLNQ